MPIDYAKLLAHGAGSWLQYEQACGHIGLFSEKYLAQPIGNILSGQTGNRVHAEFEHPVLAPLMAGRGRRASIDFAVCDPYPQITIAVESKWIGRSTPDMGSILWDLVRLELINHHSNARAIFALGGRRRDLDRFFSQPDLYSASTNRRRLPLLRYDTNALHTVSIGPVDRVRTPYLSSEFERYPNLAFPSHIRTRRTAPFPALQTSDRFQVYAWEVRSLPRRATFLGGDMSQIFPRPLARRP